MLQAYRLQTLDISKNDRNLEDGNRLTRQKTNTIGCEAVYAFLPLFRATAVLRCLFPFARVRRSSPGCIPRSPDGPRRREDARTSRGPSCTAAKLRCLFPFARVRRSSPGCIPRSPDGPRRREDARTSRGPSCTAAKLRCLFPFARVRWRSSGCMSRGPDGPRRREGARTSLAHFGSTGATRGTCTSRSKHSLCASLASAPRLYHGSSPSV